MLNASIVIIFIILLGIIYYLYTYKNANNSYQQRTETKELIKLNNNLKRLEDQINISFDKSNKDDAKLRKLIDEYEKLINNYGGNK